MILTPGLGRTPAARTATQARPARSKIHNLDPQRIFSLRSLVADPGLFLPFFATFVSFLAQAFFRLEQLDNARLAAASFAFLRGMADPPYFQDAQASKHCLRVFARAKEILWTP